MMQSSGATGSFVLRMAFLTASVGLHAGLLAIGWESFGNARITSDPIMVTLADGPSAGMSRELLHTSAGARVRSAEPHSAPPKALPRTAASAPALTTQATATMADSAQCAVPEMIVVGALIPGQLTVPSQEPSAVGVEEGGTVEGGASAGSEIGSLANGHGVTAGHSSTGLVLATPRYASNPKPDYPRLARQNR